MHDDGKRCVELARDGREIPDKFVRLLADNPAGCKVGEDAAQQLRIAQKRQGGLSFLGRHAWLRFFRRRLRLAPGLLQFLQFQEHAAQVALQEFGLEAGLHRGPIDKTLTLTRCAKVERVQVPTVRAGNAQRHPQRLASGVFPQSTHPVPPVPDLQFDLVGLRLENDNPARISNRRRRRICSGACW